MNYTGQTTAAPTTLNFSVINPQDKTTYTWNFGNPFDPNNGSSDKQLTSFFLQDGNYTVSLTAEDKNGCSKTTGVDIVIGQKDSLAVSNNQKYFFFSPEHGTCVGNAVKIFEMATNHQDVTTFYWDFGKDANPRTFEGYNPPEVSWSTPGPKTVTLRAGKQTEEKMVLSSRIYQIYEYPTADFLTHVEDSICNTEQATINFEPALKGNYLYNWIIDNKAYNNKIPSITFLENKNIRASLTVNNHGCQTNSSQVFAPFDCDNLAQPIAINVLKKQRPCEKEEYLIQF